MGKTIKQVSDELGVSKQAVWQRVKRTKDLAAMLAEHSRSVNGRIYIDEKLEHFIKALYSSARVDETSVNTGSDVYETGARIDGKSVNTADSKLLDTLQQTVSMLQQQLLAKDKQAKVEKELADLRFPIIPKNDAVLRVQCFGNFDVFTPNGEHVRFERSKAKELFAYLVHKQGSSCTSKELFAILFEDEPYDDKNQNLMQSYIYALKKSLKKVGAEEVLVHTYNAFAVKPKMLDCDYYRFKELDAGAVNAYQNEYMNQYSWAEGFLYDDYDYEY